MSPFQKRLLQAPILPTLIAFAAPNLVAFCSSTAVSIAETAYVGQLGISALAGITIVFPLMMLMQTLSGGAFGGSISGAISRALGGGQQALAERLAVCALTIGLGLGVAFALLIWLTGPTLFRALGAAGATLAAASAYGQVLAVALPGIWVTNIMSAVIRGSGQMALPAMVLLGSGLLQVVLGAAFAFGVGPIPGLGIAGIALGTAVASTSSAMVVLAFMCSRKSNLRLRLETRLVTWPGMRALLRPSLVAALSPIQTVATVIVTTAVVSRFGTEALAGFGIGTRLEFLLIPIAFSIGVASIPLVGAAIGAGLIERARHAAWTAAGLAAGLLGAIGLLMVIAPDLWARLFVSDGATLDAARGYLSTVGYAFPFFGISLSLYFASQGAGKLAGPILAQSLRLGIMVIGAWLLLQADASLDAVFLLATCAMIVQGVVAVLAVRMTRWGGLVLSGAR
jgi:putative MATE family efflux protein